MVSRIKDLGIVLPSLGHSQVAYDSIESLPELQNRDRTIDVTFFYEDLVPSSKFPPTAVMNFYECWGYSGHVVCTNIQQAYKLSAMYGKFTPYFYVYNFDWLLNHSIYELYYKVCQSNFKWITRTDAHAQIVENNFNTKPIFNLEQFNLDELHSKLEEYHAQEKH